MIQPTPTQKVYAIRDPNKDAGVSQAIHAVRNIAMSWRFLGDTIVTMVAMMLAVVSTDKRICALWAGMAVFWGLHAIRAAIQDRVREPA